MSVIDIRDFLQRAADRNGFVRERYEDRHVPVDISTITMLPFFGDLRSTFVLSSLLLRRYKEELKPSKYFILCSWPGFHSLFPYVDEYWAVGDESQFRRMFGEAEGFTNKAEGNVVYMQNINEFFRDVVKPKDLLPYYSDGLTDDYWKRFKQVVVSLPMVPSAAILGKDFNRDLAMRAGYKVFIMPSTHARCWRNGRSKSMPVPQDFWMALIDRLLKEKYVPVLWKHPLAYDLSVQYTTSCAYVNDKDIGRVLGAMRATGCVLDVFNGTSRLALAARCPFLACDERSRYSGTKEYEIDDLCGGKLPKQYIFSFSTIINGGTEGWESGLINSIMARLGSFLPTLNRDAWPLTAESTEVVPYGSVRTRKQQKIGVKFIKINKDEVM
jgi:hypothetical protein